MFSVCLTFTCSDGRRFFARLLLDVGLSVLRYAAPGGECAEADAEIDEQA